MTTANFDLDNLIIEGVKSDFELLPEGIYDCEVASLDSFESTDKAGEKYPAMKVAFRIVTGDWANETFDTIVSLYRTDKTTGRVQRDDRGQLVRKDITNDKYNLHKLWKAAMGETPIEGGRYRVADLKGKRLQVVVVHKANEKGHVWPRPDNYLPPAQSRRRGASPAVVEDIDDR